MIKPKDQVNIKPKRTKKDKQEKYLLRLYVTGNTPQSTRAIINLKKICEGYLKGRYDLEIIDIYKRPELARGEQIVAAPTLVKLLPSPMRKLIGDLSSVEKVLLGLDLKHLDQKGRSKEKP